MGSRRPTKACARCRKKKIKCDFNFPSCGSCSKVDVECLGFNAVEGIDRPRSAVAHLENRIALLETELAQLKSNNQTPSPLETVNVAVDSLTMRLADAIGSPSRRARAPRSSQSDLPLTSETFLSPSTMPPLSQGYESPSSTTPLQTMTISSVPRNVIDIMLKNYCSIWLPQYPCVDETKLYEACDRIYSDDAPSNFDCFSVAITLAISANTLIKHDEGRATTAAEGFWASAATQLDHIAENTWERVQALQLMAHYGLLSPGLVNCSNCAAAATRLCFQLGLHRELPSHEQSLHSRQILNTRRRLFWTSYSIDAAVHSLSRRPFIWPNSAVTAKYPEFISSPRLGSQTSTTAYIWSLRQMETEITLTMHHPNVGYDDAVSVQTFPEWFSNIHDRLDSWYHSVREDTEVSDKIQFYEIHYRTQVFRLNTLSARCPAPTFEMRTKALKSALMLIKDLYAMQRLGKLFYVFHYSHYVVEFGLSLLETITAGAEDIGKRPTHLDNIDVALLTGAVRSIPALLQQLSYRWPPLQQTASTFDSLSAPILQSLERYSEGDHLGYITTPSVKLRIRHLLMGSFLTNSVHEPLVDTEQQDGSVFVPDNIETLFAVPPLLLPDGEAIFHMQQQVPINNSLVAIDPNQALPSQIFDRSWSIDNAFQHGYNQTYPNTDLGTAGSVTDENFFWDIAGLNTDDIFTALLEGRDIS
ncbi:uncharacterized protein BP5553_01607 [Venustampulla echinocandica]|uniref:Zn(2)-C6 fungal-type domain-containing protein n=1 Tax=Venustampulla echinocandica TaxID=2656787 RepID=A0A370U1I2_9HELO|nr:uncharacterized protein BP5553_01607 [Venustampulla echinocandica]RDL41628.1 hypothetical protein BP5553_01607 [Venustampulla echinocandica]